MHLGGCEYEYYMSGRLLKRFEQRIECAVRQHMHLIDYVNLILGACGQICDIIAQIANIVNAVVRGGVDLGDVEHRAVVDASADFTLAARVAVLRTLAVDRLCEYFCSRGLARSA